MKLIDFETKEAAYKIFSSDPETGWAETIASALVRSFVPRDTVCYNDVVKIRDWWFGLKSAADKIMAKAPSAVRDGVLYKAEVCHFWDAVHDHFVCNGSPDDLLEPRRRFLAAGDAFYAALFGAIASEKNTQAKNSIKNTKAASNSKREQKKLLWQRLITEAIKLGVDYKLGSLSKMEINAFNGMGVIDALKKLQPELCQKLFRGYTKDENKLHSLNYNCRKLFDGKTLVDLINERYGTTKGQIK